MSPPIRRVGIQQVEAGALMSDQEVQDMHWMAEAMQLANAAAEADEVPVGAILVLDDQIIGRGFNRPISSCDPTAHAEINALRDAAARVGNYRLLDSTMYVTLEPCAMCAGALVHARVARLVYGAAEPKAGAVDSRQRFFDNAWLNHRVTWASGVMQAECSEQLSAFFRRRRQAKREAKERQGDNSA